MISPLLSICIIGKNEADNLPSLIDHLNELDLPYPYECLYVDSASVDDSVALAQHFFDQIIVLENSPNLCASAGRYVGTHAARAPWILYLDADMKLQSEFVDFLRSLPELALESGWVGSYAFISNKGAKTHKLIKNAKPQTTVMRFGGAVLLPKQKVITARNWNPRIFANEEMDLYTRLRGIGVTIKHSGTGMITHPTEPVPLTQRLLEYFLPVARKRKKFMGFGQVVASRNPRGLVNLIRYYSEPFVYWFGLLGAATLAIFWPLWSLLLLLVSIIYVSLVKGPNFAVSYLGLPIRLVLGYRAYEKAYTPEIHSHWCTDLPSTVSVLTSPKASPSSAFV